MVQLPLVLRETPGEQERCGGLGMCWAAGAAPQQADVLGSVPGYACLLGTAVFWSCKGRDGPTEIFQ